MPKILFIAAHRQHRSPSQRFRFEQYFSFLEKNGFECRLAPLLDEEEDKIFYSEGNLFKKALVLLNSYRKRQKDIALAREYDILFIQREAYMAGGAFFEKQFKKTGKKIVFDFDDAIWLPNISDSNRRFTWMKNPSKTSEIIALSDAVIAGNTYLAGYAKRYNANVHCIPTTIDTGYHQRKAPHPGTTLCIGWTGSHTTIQHFNHAIPVLKELKQRYGNKISFKVIGDPYYRNEELNIQGEKWDLHDEIEQLSKIDIGIMPLPDNEWSQGKCGLKGLQYMALEIPCVMSPVGVNREILEDGVNGFLAGPDTEWVEKISRLIEDPELRQKIGSQARRTVEEKYSVNSQKERYLGLLKSLVTPKA